MCTYKNIKNGEFHPRFCSNNNIRIKFWEREVKKPQILRSHRFWHDKFLNGNLLQQWVDVLKTVSPPIKLFAESWIGEFWIFFLLTKTVSLAKQKLITIDKFLEKVKFWFRLCFQKSWDKIWSLRCSVGPWESIYYILNNPLSLSLKPKLIHWLVAFWFTPLFSQTVMNLEAHSHKGNPNVLSKVDVFRKTKNIYLLSKNMCLCRKEWP